MKKTGIVGKIADGFAESTRAVHEINKENIAAVKAGTKANFDEAAAPNPGMVKFMEAEGLGNKIKAIAENIKEGAAENSEKEKARRAEIRNHESYRTFLKEQRAVRQKTIRHKN